MPTTEPDSGKTFVVSIHDVSPLTYRTVELILAELERRRITKTSLLVIPHHHEKVHFLDDREFCAWLLKKAEAGHEAVIHGYTHRRKRQAKESALTRGMTRIYTADEGEFFDISKETALVKVAKAQSEFRSLGLDPTGFIAPAWLLSSEAEEALKHAGIHYTTRLRQVIDLRNGTSFTSQSLVYSVRSGWRRWTSLRWNAFLFSRLKSNQLLRLGIHPPDFQHASIREQLLNLAAKARENRRIDTYDGWCTPLLNA